MPGTKTASIVIPNYNGGAHLPALLACLAQQTAPDFEVIVVDNGSGDDSLARIDEDATRPRPRSSSHP